MSRIDHTFQRLRAAGRRALITFITAGDPSLEQTAALVAELAARGSDIIELGVPFSDPLADGPTIQAASARALAGGVTLEKIIAMVGEIRRRSQVPLVLMSYYNPILSYGVDAFAAAAAKAGVDGVIVPDLPLEEGGELAAAASRAGLDLIQLVAPTSGPERRRELCARSRGFVYYVTVTGITGVRRELPPAAAAALDELRRVSPLPVAAGFGISTPAQAAAIGRHADGVIVGSALVKIIAECGDSPELPARVGTLAAALRRALDDV